MSAGKIFVVILGVFILLIGLALSLGGGALLWANVAVKDGDGYYSTRTLEIRRDAYAITTYPARINFGAAGIIDWPNLVKIKVSVTNQKEENLFVGILTESKLKEYLGTVTYDEIRELRINHPFSDPKIAYTRHTGSSEPKPPASQDIWSESASGDVTEGLTWGVEEGSYSVVVMNEDGSRGLDVVGSVGVKVPIIFGLGIGLLAGGIVLVIFAFLLIYLVISENKRVNPTE